MFSKIVIFFALVMCTYAQVLEQPHPAPEPYSFSFESPNADGSSSAREETGDANGRITGWYIIKGLDGQDRRVDYVADEEGFRAEVSTSEIGTITHEASNAIYRSSGPSVADLIAQWAAAGGSRSSGSGASRATLQSTFISEAKPVKLTETVVTSREPQVTPEGYVLVPASAARSAGINAIGSEIRSLQGLNFGQQSGTRTRFNRRK